MSCDYTCMCHLIPKHGIDRAAGKGREWQVLRARQFLRPTRVLKLLLTTFFLFHYQRDITYGPVAAMPRGPKFLSAALGIGRAHLCKPIFELPLNS